MKHISIFVSGKVQGVYYRQSTLKTARRLCVNGFVRNAQNGNVYIEAEGTEEQLNKLIEWCKTGPPHAVVVEAKVMEGVFKNFACFTITR